MVKKLFLFTMTLTLTILVCYSSGLAAQNVEYDRGRLKNYGYFDGFWCSTVLPRLRSDWSTGMDHKINHEFWFLINGSSGDWVEMGFHSGYGYNIDGSVNNRNFYEGLFIATLNNNTWSLTAFPSYGWRPGQYHTMGTLLRKSSDIMYADMRTDNKVALSYRISSLPSAPRGSIDVGMEFGMDQNGVAIQWAESATAYPITIDNLYVRNSYGWHKWSEFPALRTDQDGWTNMSPSYNYHYNHLLFEKGR